MRLKSTLDASAEASCPLSLAAQAKRAMDNGDCQPEEKKLPNILKCPMRAM